LNIVAKWPPNLILGSKKLIKLRRYWLKSRKAYFAFITAYAKFRIGFRRFTKALINPVKCLARRALNVHLPKIIKTQGRIKGTACKRQLW